MAASHELGRRGEERAAGFLRSLGWTLLARNFRFGHKEIDIVARRGRVVAFVEVKTRSGSAFGAPLESVGAAKQREIARVARFWIARHGRPGDEYRFDAVAVLWPTRSTRPEIVHVPDAWRLDGP